MQIDRETLEEVEAALAGVPGALNASFGAGSEERENGSARRQAKFGERVDATREAVSSALARLRKAMEAKDGCSFSPDLMAGGTDCALCGRPWKDTPNG